MSNIKKIRIVFGVPEGGPFSEQFASAAVALSDAECLFLGFSWSTGFNFRKSKLKFKHSPLRRIGIQMPRTIPHLAECVSRGYSQNSIPDSAKKAFATVRSFVEYEIDHFAPDVVVTGPNDGAICNLLEEAARSRDIPVISIQTSFLSDYFVIHSKGCEWIKYLSNYKIPDSTYTCHNVSEPILRSISAPSSICRKQMVLRGLERLFRLGYGGVSFDTLATFASRAVSKIYPKKWLPTIATLDSIEAVKHDYVLVALNQPALTSSDSPSWVDLLSLALAATPEDVPIIVRPHPSEPAKDLPFELENALRLRCSFISRVGAGPDLSSIIKHCRAVLTLNSAVGMEAVLAGKLVFTFCPAFYARPGMAHAVTRADVGMIRTMMTNHGQHQPDPVKVKEFLQWLLAENVISAQLVSSRNCIEKPLSRYIADLVKQRRMAN